MNTPIETSNPDPTTSVGQVYPVYRIRDFDEGSNAFGVARAERWQVSHDRDFPSLEEAKDYIRDSSRQCTILPNFLRQWDETKPEDRSITKEQLIDQFCFTNDRYLKYRRLFIQKPNISALQKALKEDGIQVINLNP